jgi:capsular exopolysaccharide synthesis family protein
LTIITFVAAGLLISVAVCALLPNEYKATATLFVDKDSSGGLDLGSLSSVASAVGGTDDVKTSLTTHATVLQSDTTALQVIHNLGLEKVSPYSVGPGIFGWNKHLKAELGMPLENAPYTRERILDKIDKRMEVKITADTRLITVAYRDHDPQRAAAIANNFVVTYVHEYLQAKFQATAQASDWLQDQLNTLKSRVSDAQQKLSDYERQTGLSVLMLGLSGNGDQQGGSMGGGVGISGSSIPAVEKLMALNQELTAAEGDRITKEAIYHLTQTQSPEVVLGLSGGGLVAAGGSSAISGGGLAALQGLRQQEASVRAEYGDAISKYGTKNPHIAELQGQLSAIDQSIQQELSRINQRAKNDYELAKQTESGISASYSRQQDEVNKLNDSTVKLELLAGEAISSRELYNGLYAKLQEANVEAGVQATNLTLVDAARPPATATRPNWLTWPGIGLGAGLLLGIGIAFLRENFDDSIITTEQVESVSWFPVLSFIPSVREKDGLPGSSQTGETKEDRSFLISRPNTPMAESYRTLRTAIQLSAIDVPLRTLLITSPMSADGKTTSSYNLAVAFAQNGIRVVIIDADMRKPRLHTFFDVNRTPGLSEVLTGSATFSETVVRHSSVESLYFLPAGTPPPNPAELLGSRRLDAVLDEARKEFDLVLVDSPPLLVVTDPVILSTRVDGTILVIRSGRTTKKVLKRASEILARSSGRKLGIVLNGVDTRSVEYYYSYGYYGDDKYYGEEAPK